jgi:hypothetical protein
MGRRWLVFLISHGIGFKSNASRSRKKIPTSPWRFNGEKGGGKL